MLNEDYKDILSALLKADAEFLVVGAYALAAHGLPRATGDIDIFVKASPENSGKVYCALAEFGAPLAQINEGAFMAPGIIFQMGVVPRRIDIITAIDGVTFDDAWPERKIVQMEGLSVPVISRRHLVINKSSTGRDKDLLDLKLLGGQISK